jgi:hypothetical protein
MRENASIAFWTFVTPMTSLRALRLGVLLFIVACLALAALVATGTVSERIMHVALTGLRHGLIVAGVPIGAVLLSEMSLRDGMTNRTLLYPLLGPTPKVVLAVVRTLVSATLLAIGAIVLLLLIRVFMRDGFSFLGREIMAVVLAAYAYVGLFGLIHLYNRRGLISGLAFFLILDKPLSAVPFKLRYVAPSYHVGVVGNQLEAMKLPIPIEAPASSVFWSSVFLVVLFAATLVITAWAFRRKDLGELC